MSVKKETSMEFDYRSADHVVKTYKLNGAQDQSATRTFFRIFR